MADTVTFTIDGVEVKARANETIMQAADAAGVYIPRLCFHKELEPHGSCRVCTVMVNGKPQAACTQPVAQGIAVENSTERLLKMRRSIVEMLFIEGNHYCMFCEKSGNCELQGTAYRLAMLAPKYPFLFPKREIDASHPDVLIDHNRCILCARCVRASRDIDGKTVFGFTGRGVHKRLAVDSEKRLGGTALKGSDRATDICPVGAVLRKRTGFAVPIGRRLYDSEPIGSDIEKRGSNR